MTLDAGAAARPDRGRVIDARRQDEAVTGLQLDRIGVRTDVEGDGAGRAHQELRVPMPMRRVLITRPVAPRVRLNALGAEAGTDTLGIWRLGIGPVQRLEAIGQVFHATPRQSIATSIRVSTRSPSRRETLAT